MSRLLVACALLASACDDAAPTDAPAGELALEVRSRIGPEGRAGRPRRHGVGRRPDHRPPGP
ncbi:MAG: hypothetical protein R3F60_11715 [bacterium]